MNITHLNVNTDVEYKVFRNLYVKKTYTLSMIHHNLKYDSIMAM